MAFYLDKGIDPGDGNSDAGGGLVRFVDLLYRAPDKKLRIIRIPNLKAWDEAAPGWHMTLMVRSDRPNSWTFIDSAEGGGYK